MLVGAAGLLLCGWGGFGLAVLGVCLRCLVAGCFPDPVCSLGLLLVLFCVVYYRCCLCLFMLVVGFAVSRGLFCVWCASDSSWFGVLVLSCGWLVFCGVFDYSMLWLMLISARLSGYGCFGWWVFGSGCSGLMILGGFGRCSTDSSCFGWLAFGLRLPGFVGGWFGLV